MPLFAAQIAYRAVRTRGTIGGAIALADPAADWLTAMLALESQIALVGPNGRRTVPIADFVTGPYSIAIGHAELIEAMEVPRRTATERWGRCKVVRKTGEYAESMAIAVIDRARRTARVVVGALDGAPSCCRAQRWRRWRTAPPISRRSCERACRKRLHPGTARAAQQRCDPRHQTPCE